MNKLIFTLSAAILFNALPTQNMEQELTIQTDCPLPNFKLEDELIFACCLTQPAQPKKSLDKSEEAFKDSIQNFIKMRITCKKYSESLTDEKIGNFCKNHSTYAKRQTVRNLIPSSLGYKHHIHLMLFLHALDDEQSNSSLLSWHVENWIKDTIEKNNVYFIEPLFKKQIVHPNTAVWEKPLFFYAETIEMAQLCFKYGADLHTTHRKTTYNVLTHIKHNKNYPPELTEFYLNHDVKKLEQ